MTTGTSATRSAGTEEACTNAANNEAADGWSTPRQNRRRGITQVPQSNAVAALSRSSLQPSPNPFGVLADIFRHDVMCTTADTNPASAVITTRTPGVTTATERRTEATSEAATTTADAATARAADTESGAVHTSDATAATAHQRAHTNQLDGNIGPSLLDEQQRDTSPAGSGSTTTTAQLPPPQPVQLPTTLAPPDQATPPEQYDPSEWPEQPSPPPMPPLPAAQNDIDIERAITAARQEAERLAAVAEADPATSMPPVLPDDPNCADWAAIDAIDPWACALNAIPLMRELPAQFREGFATAFGEAIRKVLSGIHNNEHEDRDRALKWVLVVPQLLLRNSRVRGAGRALQVLTKRFEAWEHRDFRTLLQHWQRDCARATAAPPPTPPPGKSNDLRKVEALIADGEIAAAVRLLLSDGVADHTAEAIVQQMASKHPVRQQPVGPCSGQRTPAVAVDLGPTLRGLRKRAAAGVTGPHNEHLRYLAFQYESAGGSAALPALNKFATLWANGGLPGWYHMLVSTAKLVALVKPAPGGGHGEQPTVAPNDSLTWWNAARYGHDLDTAATEAEATAARLGTDNRDARPVGMGDCLRRAIEKCVTAKHAANYRRHFYPQQVGCGVRGSAAKLVTAVRELLRRNPSFIVVRIDLKNAYNLMHRAAMLGAVIEAPLLRHAYHLLRTSFIHKSRVYMSNVNCRAPFDSEEGGQQGSPPVSMAFCAALHPAVLALDEALAGLGGAARFLMDDGYAVGPAREVFAAVAAFETAIRPLGGTLNRGKCEVTSLLVPTDAIILSAGDSGGDGNEPGTTYAEDFKVVPGILCAGVPIGSSDFVATHLADLTSVARRQATHVTARLGANSLHSLWCVVHQSLASRLDHWHALVEPSRTLEMAQAYDKTITDAKACALPDTMFAGGHLTEDEKELVQIRLQLPSALHGTGGRKRLWVRLAAFVASSTRAVCEFPDSTDAKGVTTPGFLPQATWAHGAAAGLRDEHGPLHALHAAADTMEVGDEAGTLSHELRSAWEQLQGLAGNPEDGPLAPSVDTMSAGLAHPQRALTHAVETHMADLATSLTVRILGSDGGSRRPAEAFANACKLSTQWTGSRPCADPKAKIRNCEFTSAVALSLGVPVECCVRAAGAEMQGAMGGQLDPYGDEITGVIRPGNPWITQHNYLADTMTASMRRARMAVRTELHGHFTSHLPVEALTRYDRQTYGERGRDRSFTTARRIRGDIVLDFQATEEGAGGVPVNADVKTLHHGRAARNAGYYDKSTRSGVYGHPSFIRAVDLRSAAVPAQYRRHADKIDQQYAGSNPGGPAGPVARAVLEAEVVGMSFGAHGEACGNVHALLSRIAEASAATHWRVMGCLEEADARAVASWTLRRDWGMAAFRANGRLLAGNMQLVGGVDARHFAEADEFARDGALFSGAGLDAYEFAVANRPQHAPAPSVPGFGSR